jgi:hypothetical protein
MGTFMPEPSPVISRLAATCCRTSMKPKDPIAKQWPRSRRSSPPIAVAAAAARRALAASASGKGRPTRVIRMPVVYAPMPRYAAAPKSG